MVKRKQKLPAADAVRDGAKESGQPEVIVDFVFDRGKFHVVVENIGAVPAHRVSVAFARKFYGLGGRQEMSGLRLFRRIEFLGPHRRIETFLDFSRDYFRRGEPTRHVITIVYYDEHRRRHERPIVHDLRIYQDLSYLTAPDAATPSFGAMPMISSPSPQTLRTNPWPH